MTAAHEPPQMRPLQFGDPMPANAAALMRMGEFYDWTVIATYAEGRSLPTRLRPDGRLVCSVAVRLRKPGVRLYALWVDGRYASGGTPTRPMLWREVTAWVQQPVQPELPLRPLDEQ